MAQIIDTYDCPSCGSTSDIACKHCGAPIIAEPAPSESTNSASRAIALLERLQHYFCTSTGVNENEWLCEINKVLSEQQRT